VDLFTRGECHLFARALNELSGWPIYTFIPKGGIIPLIHAFVLAPHDLPVDIEGMQPMDTFRKKWSQHLPIAPIEFDALMKHWATNKVWDRPPIIKRAEKLAPIIYQRSIAVLDSMTIE
jgi:hypothetical protein